MKQLFHIANLLFIHKEQNHMVARLDHRGIVGDQHLFVANDRADGRPRWLRNIGDGPAHHLARLRIAMGNCLDGFRRPAPE